MLFLRLRVMVLSAIVLVGFAAFLLYKLDLNVKSNTMDVLLHQTQSAAQTAFSMASISESGHAHNYAVIDTIRNQPQIKGVWTSRSDEMSKSLRQASSAFRDNLERKVFVTKTSESEMHKVSNTNNHIGRISVPVIAEQSCLACHDSYIRAGEVVGSLNLEYELKDSIMATYENMKLEFWGIVAVAAFIMSIVMMFSIRSFEKVTTNLRMAVQAATNGEFSTRIKNRGLDIFSDATKIANRFLETLDRSINSIDAKISTIFVYNKSLYNKNPLIRIGELVSEITNMFLFKNKIETARQTQDVYRELQLVISRYIKYKYLIFAEIIDDVVVSGYKVEDEINTKIALGDVKAIQKRVADPKVNVLFSKDKNYLFTSTSIDALNVIDLKIQVADNVVLYYSMMLHSKKDLSEKEKSVSRIYNYFREASLVIQNIILIKSIEESSYTDPLTKAYNRLYLEKYSNEISPKLANHIGFGVLMLDIDHFKRVNDTYGHAVGDAGIVLLTETIKGLIRSTDKLFRYGGEEFVVVLEGYDIDETQRMAEKIRAAFAMAKKCSRMEITFPHSVSIGFSAIPDFSKNLWECINQADAALYKAKDTGRNRVVKFTHQLEQEAKNHTEKKYSQSPQESDALNDFAIDDDDDDDSFLESLKLNE